MGIAMALDTLKFTSIDLDVRVTIDYLFFKSLGLAGLPSDLEWLYGFYAPTVIRNMPLENFVLLTKNSHTGFGCFPEVPWHKQEREHILKRLDIKVEHGEEIKGAKDMGTFLTVSDKEHIEIIDGYASGRSMRVLSSMIGRSS